VRAFFETQKVDVREGFTPEDDVLPQRLHEGIGNGALKGERVDHYEMADRDPQTGRPTEAKLAELGVETAAG
jgi:aldehyde:ferredoxin oxidoreductase